MPSVEVHLWIRELTRIDREACRCRRLLLVRRRQRAARRGRRRATSSARAAGLPGDLLPALRTLGLGRRAVAGQQQRPRHQRRRHPPRPRQQARDGSAPCCWRSREGEQRLDERRRRTQPRRRPAPALVPRRPARRSSPSRRPTRRQRQDGSVLPVLTHVGGEADDASRKDTLPGLPAARRDPLPRLGRRHPAVGRALDALRQHEPRPGGEEDPGLHRQRAGRRAPRRVRAEPVAQPDRPLGAARGGRRRSHQSSTCSPTGSSSGPATTPTLRYRILPPDLADKDEFRPFWQAKTLAKVPQTVREPGRASGSPSTPSSSSGCSPGSAGRWR